MQSPSPPDPNASDCLSDATLADFVNGRLAVHRLDEVERHLQFCESCSERLATAPTGSLVNRLEQFRYTPSSDARFQGKPFELGPDSRYELLAELGKGGMGQVFKARHRIMKRVVALKTIRPELMNHSEAVRRFAKEARAAARLSHPNIVSAFDAEREGDLHFLVMEFVDGESLHRIVNRNGPLDAREAVDTIRQAAEGLQHASERGMVHRDIKPHNLMLDRQGTVKILDFGLSKFRRDQLDGDESDSVNDETILTLRDTQLGTEGYMAPEQSRDARSVDVRADIYSLGCTLFFLLTNRPPFFGMPPDTEDATPDIRRFRNDLPAGLPELLDRMMRHAPEDRFSSPREVIEAIDAIDFSIPSTTQRSDTSVPGADGEVTPSPVMAAHRVHQRRRRWLTGTAVVVLVALAALMGWLVWYLASQ